MEKVQHEEATIDVFENKIDAYLHLFAEKQNIDDLRTASQSVWNACLMYIQRHAFNNPDILKQSNIIPNANKEIPSNYNSYNYELLNDICDYYIYICTLYDKEISIIGFSNLVGISNTLILEWGNNYKDSNRLSSLSSEIYKKLLQFREESLSNKLATGNKNPVGILAILNRHYAWNLPGVSKEQANKSALTAAELPKLGDNSSNCTMKNLEVLDIETKETQ